MADSGTENRKALAWYLYLFGIAACLALVFALFSHARETKQFEETVTIDSNRPATIPTTPPVAPPNELRVQDREVETVGDKIAAATVYLKKKQGANALHALHQAQAATNHALSISTHDGGSDKELMITLNELSAAEHAIQRGAFDDAAKQLNALNHRLDALAR